MGSASLKTLEKVPSGINGLDEITGGLPRERIILVAGGPGSGKTLFGLHFLVAGATQYDEPGVHVAFEESGEEIARNVGSLGWDIETLTREQRIIIDHVQLDREEILETGVYDLEGLFIRLKHAIESIGAKRVVLDTVEYLFAGLPNELILRSELKRLFRWLKEQGVTTIVTGEQGTNGGITRHGLEEYVSDCVIVLDYRISQEVSTRRLRIVKYRGSRHGTNEYPFVIGGRGISVLPITTAGLVYPAGSEFVSTGVAQLDELLGRGKGYYKGSSVLISGTAGTGKSSFAAHFAHSCCARGERCLYFAFEESRDQITRNMRSIGLDLGSCSSEGLLIIHSTRPSQYGLEEHLIEFLDLLDEHRPDAVVIDPISNMDVVGSTGQVKSIMTRFIDHLKSRMITSVFTELINQPTELRSHLEVGVSSLMDTWISLRHLELQGVQRKAIHVVKSRGMEINSEVREFRFSERGIEITSNILSSGRAAPIWGGSERTGGEDG
jgi:circadian clock protein KaiC